MSPTITFLLVGFNRDVSGEDVEKRTKNNIIMVVLYFHPTKPGYIPYYGWYSQCKQRWKSNLRNAIDQ